MMVIGTPLLKKAIPTSWNVTTIREVRSPKLGYSGKYANLVEASNHRRLEKQVTVGAIVPLPRRIRSTLAQ
jgi:hypothetical protein